MSKLKKKITAFLIVSFLFHTSVSAESVTSVESLALSLDMVWIMVAALLVFFMHAGFAMVESGFTRSKNTLNILMKNFLTISTAAILYLIVGYAFMFGTSSYGIIGTDGFFLKGHESEIGFFVFQAMFAATCATIISGAVAERIKLSSYMLITVLMTALIYPVVGHWIWGDGWLAALGFTDFAGSTVVHLTGALGALVAVKFLGARIGKYSNGKVNVIPGHSIPLGALGVFILWFGWFGFNGGSTLAADPTLIPQVITTTLLSASSGVIAAALYSHLKYKRIDASLTLNGALAGLVGITAGTADVSLLGAIFIGLVAGVILIESVQFIDRKLKLDDPVGAIAVHGVCGVWGTVAVGLFATQGGLFYGGGIQLLAVQLLGILAVIAWTVASLSTFLLIYTKFRSIRVTREEEIAGLDFAEHGSSAYEMKESLLYDTKEATFSLEFGNGLIHRLNNISTKASTTKI
mgnify:FL=1